MKKIKDIVKKPSEAIDAMIFGLYKQSQRPDFKINMMTFGASNHLENEIVCFGCAATCTAQEIAQKNFTGDEINFIGQRAAFLGFSYNDLSEFEDAIDDFREGDISTLFEFYALSYEDYNLNREYGWYLDSINWLYEIPKIQNFVNHLKTLGL